MRKQWYQRRVRETRMEDVEWGSSVVSSAYAEQIKNYKPSWQSTWTKTCNRKCCFSPDCGRIQCEWCGKRIIPSASDTNVPPNRYNCPNCWVNPEVCVDFCETCFNAKNEVYHQHVDFVLIDSAGNHTVVKREISDAAYKEFQNLNPDVQDLPHKSATTEDLPHVCFCMVSFEIDEEIVVLKCGHAYHHDCLQAHVDSKVASDPVCPTCKVQVK
eukprot:TRINITY_DN1181_c0_g1_i8.p1 TRINITY_DN1181_c0_g1~~TRINITY_DN1181_c0_g1_i8.p1  ORF type:complete len:214 (-),score=27.80 TRINITY_DN1181_c0_g1_i8:1269-1910(-)